MTFKSILILLNVFVEISNNVLNLSSCAEWNINSIKFPKKPYPELELWSLFIDKTNTVYIADKKYRDLYEWHNGSSNSTRIIFKILFQPQGLFVLSTGDIYISGIGNGQVNKWIVGSNVTETVAQFGVTCVEIFISIDNMIYCSMSSSHIVATKPLYNNSNIMKIVAGVGFDGSEAPMLRGPQGIFVTANLDLYVADQYNHRIQLFHRGEINGIAIPDKLDTFKLNQPRSVVLDANNQIYIVEYYGNRVVVKTHSGFRCLLSCGILGSSTDRLSYPRTLAFDSYGNMFVTDHSGDGLQKFFLSKNICDSNDNIETRTISTISTLTSTTGTAIAIESVYKSVFTIDSPKYSNDCSRSMKNYESVNMFVYKQGNYDFLITSTTKIYIYMYKDIFNPMKLHANCLVQYSTNCDNCQIQFRINLQSNRTYQLAIRTATGNLFALFSVISIGPSNISFNRMNISMVNTMYFSQLTNNSHECSHHQSQHGFSSFFCEILEINVSQTGYYVIRSNSTTYMYLYIYEKNFTLFHLDMNKVVPDVNIECNHEFKISLYRQRNTSFILIVTTKEPYELDTFSITVNGPNYVTMKSINDVPSILESNYSSYLSNNSQKYDQLNCYYLNFYYQALKIDVNTSDYYMFSLISNAYAFANLFEYYFEPINSQKTFLTENVIAMIDNQFTFIFYLNSSITYILVVAIQIDKSIAEYPFSLIVQGPSKIVLKQIHNIPVIVQSIYKLELTRDSQLYGHEDCYDQRYIYESVQINVFQSDDYTLSSLSFSNVFKTFGNLYIQHFDSYNPFESLYSNSHGHCEEHNFKMTTYLQSTFTYILVVAIERWATNTILKEITILVSGRNNVTFNQIVFQRIYTSELTEANQVYPRVCGKGNYYYETIEINVQQNGSYIFDSNNSILLYGYLYENDFDPSYPNRNLLVQSNFSCDKRFRLGNYLQMNIKYILVITTFDPNIKGSFAISIAGTNNVTLNRIVKEHSKCVVGDQCNLYAKSIGLTINDILRNQIQPNISLTEQSFLIRTVIGITMLMFFMGFINSIFSLVTFKDKKLRIVGCGIYLLASSITSLLTILMFTVKFWFVLLTQIHSTVNSSILRVDCLFIGPLLKLCLYFDGWLNACVAIERTINVSKGVNFDKKLSRRVARWLLLIIPILIISSIIHEPIHHQLFEYTTQRYESMNNSKNTTKNSMTLINERHVLCVIRYSTFFQIYNTITLYFHLAVPFIINLCSALFIIFGTARRRLTAQNNRKTFKEHVLKQISEHKQLLISPIILLVLAMPRLILSVISGCVDLSLNSCLYLSAYLISYTPPMLIFAVFVLPSKLYMKTFKDLLASWRRQNHQ